MAILLAYRKRRYFTCLNVFKFSGTFSINKVYLESQNTHFIDDMKLPSAVEVEDSVEGARVSKARKYTYNKCSGSVCFWASWIRIH
jgi:hypothetical protein